MLIPHSKPGTSLKNKTGGWKVTKPVLIKEKCIKCTFCQFYCPENCISGTEKNPKEFPKFNYDYCKGCGICAQVCPKKAIKMVKEEK